MRRRVPVRAFRLGRAQLVVLPLSLRVQVLQVDAVDVPVAYHDAPVDDDRLEVAAGAGEHQGLNRVDELTEVAAAQVEDRDVRLGADRQTAEVGPPQRPRAAARRTPWADPPGP